MIFNETLRAPNVWQAKVVRLALRATARLGESTLNVEELR